MKIQRLTIHNMASIEDAEIDFSAKPLVDSDVFLITGKTGSGKSTILDSICLALYGTTPRLSGTRMQGAVNDAGKEVHLDDPAQLLRENTGEGYVRLTFEGSNGVPYEAEWSIARARNKPTGKLQGKKWVVKNLRDGMQYSKDAEIRSVISEAVKLSFEQFCRTTMLAQGEFTRFLNSKDEEKAEILEMITGAGIYSKIGAKVYEITQRKKSVYDAAKSAVEGIHLLTDDEKNEKLESIEENTRQSKE
ncbi:MAG: AAA family ATPase, partial [Bacteroidales bacterium]|nr:AAA family ATPase [Bacteroidales bacterium]